MNEETFHAVVQGVYQEDLGDALTVAANIGDTVLHVRDVADFDEEGGFLLLDDAVLEYDTCDDDDSTITLTAPLTVAAAVDDRVDVWDDANGQKASVYKAVVDQIDGFDGVATAVVSQGLAHALAQTMRDGTGESVTLAREDSELQVTAVHGRGFALASLQYLQGGMTTRQSEDEAGVDILGADSGTPGVYVFGTNGNKIVLRDDGSEGIIEFFSGRTDESSGWVNPGYDDPTSTHTLDIKTSHDPGESSGHFTLHSSEGFGAVVPTMEMRANTQFLGNDIRGSFIGVTGEIHCENGFVDDTLASDGQGLTGASIGGGGKLQRTSSSRRYKDNIEPLSLDDARRVLDLEPVTFTRKDEQSGRVYPGFLAEQVAETGAELWVNRDAQGRPDGVRYDELTAALVAVIREQQQRLDRFEARLAELH